MRSLSRPLHLTLALGLALAAPGLVAASSAAAASYQVCRIAVGKPMAVGLLGNAADVFKIEVRSDQGKVLGKDGNGKEPVLGYGNPVYALGEAGTYQLWVYGNPAGFDLGVFWGLDRTYPKHGFHFKPGADGRLTAALLDHSAVLVDPTIRSNPSGLLISIP